MACLNWVIPISTQTHDGLVRGVAFDASLLGPELLWETWSLARELIREIAWGLAVHLRHLVGYGGSILISLFTVARAVFIALSSIHFRLFFFRRSTSGCLKASKSEPRCSMYPLTIAFLRSLRKERTAVPRHLKRFQRPEMNTSLETINVMLSSDTSKSYTAMSDLRVNDASPSIRCNCKREENSEKSRIATSEKTADRHVIFQDIKIQREATIHSIFRECLEFDKTDNIDALDDRIAKHERTTSSYEELPHRLRISKKHQSMTSSERLMELIKTNGFLLQKLTYHKDTRAAEMKFLKKAIKFRADIEAALTEFGRALKERSKARADAESILLNYWGIDLGDGNIEDSVF